jgi:hypothetical protein
VTCLEKLVDRVTVAVPVVVKLADDSAEGFKQKLTDSLGVWNWNIAVGAATFYPLLTGTTRL